MLSTLLHPHEPRVAKRTSRIEPRPEPAPLAPLTAVEHLSFVDACLWLVDQFAVGLAHAHSHGLFHRDLKPADVLMTDDGVPMPLDFNTSADAAITPSGGRIGGTLVYMAPEHLRAFLGEACVVDARADLYSLGIVLYELLTGAMLHPMPSGLSPDATARVVLARRAVSLPRPSSFNAAVSPAVDAIVGKLLAIDPGRRYATGDDLQRHLADRPLKHARAGSVRESARKWRRRHPRLIAGLLVAAVAGLGVVAPITAPLVRQAGIERRAREVQSAEAEVQYRRAAAQLQTANVLLASSADSPAHAEGSAIVREILAAYGFESGPDWFDQPTAALLPPEQHRDLRLKLGESLILLTRAELRRGKTSPEALHSAIRWNDLAQRAFDDADRPAVVDRHRAEIDARRAGRPVAPASANPNERDRYFDGLDLALVGRPADALKSIVELCDRDPQHFNVWFLRGMCHDVLRQAPEAAAAFSVCIALRPDFAPAHLNRGLARFRHKQYAEADADLSRALALKPGWSTVLLNRGIVREALKQFPAAESDLTASLADPNAPTRTYLLRSRIRQGQGNKAGAAADREEGINREPRDAISWSAGGVGRVRTDPAAALADFDGAIAADPSYREAYLKKRALLADRVKRPADAILALDPVLELFPDYVEARAVRAIYAARPGRSELAKADAVACLAADSSPFRTYQMAGVYAQLASGKAEVLRLLARAFAAGFGDFKIADADSDLDPIRRDLEFLRLVASPREMQTPAR